MTGISNLGQALDQISRLKSQQITLSDFSTQIATGKKTQQFSGLGTDILRSQRARADVNKLDQYSTNITNAHRRINLMSSSVQAVSGQANTISAALNTLVQGGNLPEFETAQQLAGDVYDYIIDLMNTKDGERYLFAGSDSSVKPIEDQGLYDTYLGTFVPDNETPLAAPPAPNPPLDAAGFIGEWGSGAITTDEFIAAYSSVNENVLGYSEPLVSGTTGDVRVRVDENSDFDYTLLANNEGMKELVMALGVLKNMPLPENSPGALNDPNADLAINDIPPFPSTEKQENFYAVFNDIAAKITNAVDKLEGEEYKLSMVEAQTAVIKDQYRYQMDAFESTIADAENVDLTETVAKIQQLQIGLEASYSVTALISDLTLVNFLGR
jgi:flagellar hook-associated protein 3 FlgL